MLTKQEEQRYEELSNEMKKNFEGLSKEELAEINLLMIKEHGDDVETTIPVYQNAVEKKHNPMNIEQTEEDENHL